MAGGRYGTPSTRVATRIREVLAATQDSIVQVSLVGEEPRGVVRRRYEVEAERLGLTGLADGVATGLRGCWQV